MPVYTDKQQAITDSIIKAFEAKEWSGERLGLGDSHWLAFRRTFNTAAGDRDAVITVKPYNDSELHGFRFFGNYESQGQNALSTSFASIDVESIEPTDEAISETVNDYLYTVQANINRTYARRLLPSR